IPAAIASAIWRVLPNTLSYTITVRIVLTSDSSFRFPAWPMRSVAAGSLVPDAMGEGPSRARSPARLGRWSLAGALAPAETGQMNQARTTREPAEEDRAGLALDRLTQAEVRERAAAGQVNAVPAAPGRTLGQILRANLCTRFNAILGTLFGVVLVVGPPQDAL